MFGKSKKYFILFSKTVTNTLSMVNTTANLLDLDDMCKLYGHDCQTTHKWITLVPTRKMSQF